jgi:flagella basal body P-ring formation protein FlgA
MPVWAKAKVLVRRLCWSAKSALSAGVQPAEEQFEHNELWVNPFLASTDCTDLKTRNVRLRRPLRAGQLLIRSDLAMIPPVRRGDWVQASLTMTSAKLSFDAVAEMDGVEGQSVFIKRDGRRLRARVSGAGAVQVLSRDTQ